MNRKERIELAISKGYTCNPETGEVFGVKGYKIGKTDKYGYRIFSIRQFNKQYDIKFHQFIWYWVYRETVDYIDHINRNPSDNRISNLRKVTNSENNHNQNSKGYHFCNRQKRFVSKIMVYKKPIYIGSYRTEEEARDAYLKAKKHYFPNI